MVHEMKEKTSWWYFPGRATKLEKKCDNNGRGWV